MKVLKGNFKFQVYFSLLLTFQFRNIVKTAEIPPELLPKVQSARADLIANLAEVDDEIADLFLEELEPTQEQLITAIRNSTISRKFVPVFMGSAYHNKGVQPLLDGILDYLPAPHQVSNQALNINDDERKVELVSSSSMNFVGLAFKLEEGRYGQLTYMRVYQGTLKKGGWIVNVRTGKKIKVPRLVRMHSNEMEVCIWNIFIFCNICYYRTLMKSVVAIYAHYLVLNVHPEIPSLTELSTIQW